MTQKEQQQLTIGDTVWCLHPNFTYPFETRVTEMRVFNVNQDEPDQPIDTAIEYTLVGHGIELPYNQDGKWFVYDGDMITEFDGVQECYYTTKDNAMTGLIRTLRTLADAYLLQLENKYI